MKLHHISALDLCTQLCNNLSIDRNYTCRDKFISFTTRADSCISQELIQTDRFIRINKLFFVFNLFFLTVFSIRIVIPRTTYRT